MEKSDSDSLEEWDVVTVSQVLETGTANKVQDKSSNITTVVTDVKNGSKIPAKDKSPTATSEAVVFEPKDITVARSVDVSVAEPENETEAVPEQCIEDELRSESESQEEESKVLTDTAESSHLPMDQSGSKISVNIQEEKSTTSGNEFTIEAIQQEMDQGIVCDIIEKESSPADSKSSSCQESDSEDVMEDLVRKIATEQELAAIESSSSDIDIIEEVIDESAISSSMMSSLSLSISSPVDASSMTSVGSQFGDRYYNKEEKEESKQENIRGRKSQEREKADGFECPGTSSPRKSNKRSPSPRHRNSRQSREATHRSFYDWLVLLLEFLRNMSPYDWCIIGTVAVSLYLTVIFNQTNIFALVQKDNVMSQMKHMIDELKHDNKILKEQMLSEIKNEKAFSSFEHQIKELRKENSRLNHMLFDVAKVLDKQKDFHEKKEAEYLAPFKKEINKLKEHINVLKTDNEELQKEMMRMRYSGSHVREKEMPTKEETVQLDVESLKKWNELITLLSKELGVLAEADVLKDQKSGKDSKPFWKNLLNNFKSSFSNFRKANFSEVFKEYKEAKKKVVSDIYVLVKDFFTPEENPPVDEDDSQWRSVGDFMEDLKKKWTNIKDRLYSSDLKKFFEKDVKKSEKPSGEGHSKTDRVKIRSTYNQQGSHSKSDSTGTKEDTRWVFERAADREQQRGNTEEANWFLKKSHHNSEDKGNRHL